MSDGITDSMIASTDDPYTWEIARLRRSGEIAALKREIEGIQFAFHSGAMWEGTVSAGRYKKLGAAITRAEHELKKMQMLLSVIQEMDPNND